MFLNTYLLLKYMMYYLTKEKVPDLVPTNFVGYKLSSDLTSYCVRDRELFDRILYFLHLLIFLKHGDFYCQKFAKM